MIKLWIAGIALTLALPMAVSASQFQFNSEQHIQCPDTVGRPVINVVERVINDADSGTAGNYWAFDTLSRHYTVWETSTPGTYCATVHDSGSFKAIAGQQSPGNTDTLNGNEHGTIQGGYAMTITGSLLSSPAWRTKGYVGTVDYQCDSSGNCPGYVNWIGQYFEQGFSSDYIWWGWTYRGGRFGTWTNASDGNSGDILPAEKPHRSNLWDFFGHFGNSGHWHNKP